MPTMKEATITLPNGTSIKVYPIGALARSLNRSTCTIQCAKESGIKHGNSFALTPFTDLCYTRLSELKEKYMAHNN